MITNISSDDTYKPYYIWEPEDIKATGQRNSSGIFNIVFMEDVFVNTNGSLVRIMLGMTRSLRNRA